MGGTTSTEQQAHDQLVNSQDKKVAFNSFISTVQAKPQMLSTLNLKTSAKTCQSILSYLSSTIEQKNYNHIVPIFQVLQRLLHFETFYRDFSKIQSLTPILSALTLTDSDDSINHALECIELMVKCQVFNRIQGGCCGSNSGGVSNLSGSGSDTTNSSTTDPKLHTFESAMKSLLCASQNNLPRSLSQLFTHYVAQQGHFTTQQHIIVQTILRLLRHFMLTTLKTSTFPQISAFLSEFRVHTESILSLTINTEPTTRLEAALLLRQFLIHSSPANTTEIQMMCLNKGYLLWFVYIALQKDGVHDNVHKDWNVQDQNRIYSDVIAFLADDNEIITRLLYRMIPKCIHDNAKGGSKQLGFPNFSKQQFLSTATPEEKKAFENTTFARYLNGSVHGDWITVFSECNEEHFNPLIVWNKSDKSELIEVLLNENCDFNLQLELSPSSPWDHEGFEVDYSQQSKYLVVNRYYLHLLLPHYEKSEPKELSRGNLAGHTNDESLQRKPKKIGNRPTAMESADGLFVPTKFKDIGQDPYVISHVDLQNFMAACFQRAVVEDDVGWKLACLRMMTTLYIHHSRILQEANMMPYLIWLLTPKTATGTLFDVNEATTNVFDKLDFDNDSERDDEHGVSTNANLLTHKPGLVQTSSTTSSVHNSLTTASSHKSHQQQHPNATQNNHDPNIIASRIEIKLEKEISYSLASSFNNPRWRDQIIKFLNILFDYTGNINKFVAGNGINTLIFFINNVHRQNHVKGLEGFQELFHSFTPEQKSDFSTQNGIDMHALEAIYRKRAHSSTTSPPPHPPKVPNSNDKVNPFHRQSVSHVPTSILEQAEEERNSSKNNYASLSIQVDDMDTQSKTTQLSPSSSKKLVRNPSDFHVHSPLHRSASNTPMAIAGSPQNFFQDAKNGKPANRPHFDSDTSPILSILDPLCYHAAVSNQQQRDINPIKKIDLLTNTPQPDGIVDVAKKSLLLLLKIVTNAPRLRKKIFKPRVLSSLVQVVLLDDKDMVDAALKILIILIDANTHVIPNLARTGVFLFLLYAMRCNNICSPPMIEFINKYHTRQNVPYLNRGQSAFDGLFPEPMMNLSLQPNGGQHFCNVINNSSTVSHHILWDKSHKTVLSNFITLHLTPFIDKLTKYPFSTYTYPHDGNNSVAFQLPPLSITYHTIKQELFVGNIYVRLFNIETNRMNQFILQDGKTRKIQLFHESSFLLSLLREFTTNSKYFSTRTLTLLEHIQQLSCVQPKQGAVISKDTYESQTAPIIFFTDVEFTSPNYPEVKQQQPYQMLYDRQKFSSNNSPHDGSASPAFTADTDPLARRGSSSSMVTLSLDNVSVRGSSTGSVGTEVAAINEHLVELIHALSILIANNPQDDDVSHFKYAIHVITLLASLNGPYDVNNRLLLYISHILRALLVIPGGLNSQTFVNNGALLVILRTCVAISRQITTLSSSQYPELPSDILNPYDFTTNAKHNDNVDLLCQYFHIFTTLVLQGRSSHKPGPYIFQMTNMLLDEINCKELFNTLQSILTIQRVNIPQRQYLIASVLRLLQSFSTVDTHIQIFQQDNIVFLQDRLKSMHDTAIEAHACFQSTSPPARSQFSSFATSVPPQPSNSIAKNYQPGSSNTNLAQKDALTPAGVPSYIDLTSAGAFTPHRYILQHGLILEALQIILTSDDEIQLTVHSLGGVIDQASATPAFLGKTQTKNTHVPSLLTAYPSNKRVFPASIYLEEISYEAMQSTADPSKFNQVSPTNNRPGPPGRQLTRTNRAPRGVGNGLLLDPASSDADLEDYQKEARATDGNRGTLLSYAFGNQTSIYQPGLQDLLYAPLNETPKNTPPGKPNSPSNALVLKQRGSTLPRPQSSDSGTSDDNTTLDVISTLAGALELHRNQVVHIPCTATCLQHERSFAIRKEAVVLAALVLSASLPTLLTTPSNFQSNTYKNDPMFIDDVFAQHSASHLPSTDITSTINSDDKSTGDFSANSASRTAIDPKALMVYRYKLIEQSLLNITQQLITPGAVFQLAQFQPHTKYFLQPTVDYFSSPTQKLTSINAHCSVPIEYKQFIDSLASDYTITTPTFIWNKAIHSEAVSMLSTISQSFNYFNPMLKSKVTQSPFATTAPAAPAAPSTQAPRRPTLTHQSSTGSQGSFSGSGKLNPQSVVEPGVWPWAKQILTATPTSHPHGLINFPFQLTLLSNEVIIEGVYVRVWYAQQQPGATNTDLLPKPLTSTHLFNHICFALHRYALLAPQRLPINNNSATTTTVPTTTAINSTLIERTHIPTLSAPSIDALDTSIALDVGYIRKTSRVDEEDKNKAHFTSIVLDDNSVIDFTSPIAEKIFNTTYLPSGDSLLTTTYSAIGTDLMSYQNNTRLLALCLQLLSTDRQCEISKLLAPLLCNPNLSIEGGQHSSSVAELYGLHQLLSLLACERTHCATINIVCMVLFILQRDVIEEPQVTHPNVSNLFDLSSKQLAAKFNFSVAHDIVAVCCHYLLSLLVKPYQASDIALNGSPVTNTSTTSAASAAFRAPSTTAPTAPVGGRRDSSFGSNPFIARNNGVDQSPRNSNLPSTSTTTSGSSASLSSYLQTNPHATNPALTTLHQRSNQRVHVMLILNILYNLIMSQTLLRRGKVLETLFKTGIVATMFNIIFRPITHNFGTNAAIDSKEQDALSNFIISTVVPIKSLYNSEQRSTCLPSSTINNSSSNNITTCSLQHDTMTQLTAQKYFPFSDDIDTCPVNSQPLAIPAAIPSDYQYGKSQTLSASTSTTLPAPPGSTNPVRRFTVTSSSAPSSTDSQISNHPLNTLNNTYSSSQRLFAAKILGLLFIHPVAGTYYRNAIANFLSPQFFVTMPIAVYNPLCFLSQLYTEANTPCFSWTVLARSEASRFIQLETQNLFFYHLQLNRNYAQFLYLSEQKTHVDRIRLHELAVMRESGELDEEEMTAKVEALEAAEFATAQKIFTTHFESLYQHHILEYQRHITYIPSETPTTTLAPTTTAPAKATFGSSHSVVTSTQSGSNSNSHPKGFTGLPILSPQQITQSASSDLLDSYYGVFQYDHAIAMNRASSLSKDDEHNDEPSHFPTNQFQGILTYADTDSTNLKDRFTRIYLTHQVYVPIDPQVGLGVYLYNYLHDKRYETFDIGAQGEAQFMTNLVTQSVEHMGVISGFKQILQEYEQLHNEAIEDGYIDPNSGMLFPPAKVAQIRRDQLYQIHLLELQKQRNDYQRQKRDEMERQIAESKKPRTNRRASTLSGAGGNGGNGGNALNNSSSGNGSRSAAPPTPTSSSSRVAERGTSTAPNANNEDPIMEEQDDLDDDFSYTNISSPALLDSPDVFSALSDEHLFEQVSASVVTRGMIFELYHTVHINSTILQRMLQAITVLIERDSETTVPIAKFLNVEDKIAKLCEFIVVECSNEASTFSIDEGVYFQNIAHTMSSAEAIAAGAQGTDPKVYYPQLNRTQLERDVFDLLPLSPLYDPETNTNLLILKCSEILLDLAHPSKKLSTQSIQMMHKAKVSRWLLPALYLEHDRYEFCDAITGEVKPASQPKILFPIISLLYRIISNHPEHVDDLVNMGCLFYYLNLILQKQHIPQNIYLLCLQTMRKIAQRGRIARSQALDFLVCEFKDILLDSHHEDDKCNDLDMMFQEDSPQCPACDRCWNADQRYRLQQIVFKAVLPQLTVRVMTYSPDKGRVYLNSDILDALGYDAYNQDTRAYINEDPVVIARAVAPQSIVADQEPQATPRGSVPSLPFIARTHSTTSSNGDKDAPLPPPIDSVQVGLISTLEDAPPSDTEGN